MICLILVISFVYKGRNHFGDEYKCCADKVTLLSSLSMMTTLPYMFGDFFRIYFGDNNGWYTSPQWLVTFGNTFYYVSIILLYLSLILRVYYMFKADRQYRMSKSQIVCLVFVIIFDIIALSTYTLCVHLAETDTNLPMLDINGTRLTLTIILAGLLVISNDILINAIVLYLILKRLFHMIENLDEQYQSMLKRRLTISRNVVELELENTNVRSTNDEVQDLTSTLLDMDGGIDLDRNKNVQQEIVHLMVKLSLLTMICVIVSQFYNIAAPYLLYAKETKNNVTNVWFNEHIILILVLRAIEATVNCIILTFTFIFYQKQYNRYCNICHSTLENCFVQCIIKKMVR